MHKVTTLGHVLNALTEKYTQCKYQNHTYIHSKISTTISDSTGGPSSNSFDKLVLCPNVNLYIEYLHLNSHLEGIK